MNFEKLRSSEILETNAAANQLAATPTDLYTVVDGKIVNKRDANDSVEIAL